MPLRTGQSGAWPSSRVGQGGGSVWHDVHDDDNNDNDDGSVTHTVLCFQQRGLKVPLFSFPLFSIFFARKSTKQNWAGLPQGIRVWAFTSLCQLFSDLQKLIQHWQLRASDQNPGSAPWWAPWALINFADISTMQIYRWVPLNSKEKYRVKLFRIS